MTMDLSATLAGRRPRTERVGDEAVGPSLLVTHFEELVQAAGSAKLLKQLVLHLAMQGRLSTRDAESVEPLRIEVRRARDRLAKSGVRVRDLPPIEDGDVPWSLPPGWAWVRLGELGGFLGGGTPSKSNSSFWTGPLPWVSPKDMKQPYIDDAEDHISMAAVEGSAAKLIPKGSILCVVRGMILAHSFPVALTRREVAVNQDMKALVLAVPAVGEFVLRACQDARARVLASVERSSHGTCRLDGQVVENLLIPLPPLAEQKRIVAKVDQLMALCDDLEARQTRKREVSDRLTKSTLQALSTAEGPEEFDVAWKRVVERFDVLIDRSEKVDQLRTVILALAIRGGFEGGGARYDDADPRGALPRGWSWRRVDEVGEAKLGKMRSPEHHHGGHMRPYLRVANVLEGRIDISDVRSMNFPPADAERFALKSGDILLNEGQSVEFVGRPAIYRDEVPGACFQKTLIRFRCFPVVLPEFALLVFRAYMRTGRFQGAAVQTTNMAHLPLMRLVGIEFPVPPVHAQLQIVATVEQLLRVCDDLEARVGRSEERAAKLVEAVVRDLVA